VSESTDVEEVQRVVRRWARAFSSGDAAGAAAVWDADYGAALYQAEEFEAPFRGVDSVRAYYEAMTNIVSGFRDLDVHDLEADVLGDVAWCFLRGSATFDVAGRDEPLHGQTRQTFLLRRTADGWKVIHYHESRETPAIRGFFAAAWPGSEQPAGADRQQTSD
jgi:uncharacterized protein (TIGR02246 family)